METKHTPTPWMVGEMIPEGLIRIEATNGPYVAAVLFSKYSLLTRYRAEDNAAFIVTACNAHADLLAACIEVSAEITRVNKAAGIAVFNPAATRLLRAAIARAENSGAK